MKHLKLIVSTGLLLLVLGCAEPGRNAEVGTSDSVDESVDVQDASNDVRSILGQAESAYAAAEAKNHAWVITGRLLTSASEALEAGNEAAAMVEAKRALFTAQASVTQANKEETAWRGRVPK